MKYQKYNGDKEHVVGRVESESEDGVWYVIRKGHDGVLRCECPDFRTDPCPPEEKDCKHLRYQARIKTKSRYQLEEFDEIETV